MKKICCLALVAIALAFMIVGCDMEGKDIDAIGELVLADEVWFDAGSPEDKDTSYASVMAEADSLWWWIRGPQEHDDPIIDVYVDGDSAYVEWSRNNSGSIIVFPWVGDDTVPETWIKDLSENAKIRGIYRRTGEVSDENRGWELEKISCAIGSSNDTNAVSIDKIEIEAVDGDPKVTIEDPLNTFYDVKDLVAFNSAESVTITIYTNSENTVAFLHTIVAIWPIRTPFENMGEGVHQGTWQVQLLEHVPRFAIFDVMHESTLWDEDYAYDYSGVLFPYTIKNE
jgi:hypothetical protein